MTTADDWQVINTYKKMAKRGKAIPLKCQFCDDEVVTRLGEGDEVLFQCFTCDLVYQPGTVYLGIIRHITETYNV